MNIGQSKFDDVVKVKQFAPVIDLDWIDGPRSAELIADYIITDELAEGFVEILSSQFPGHKPLTSSIYKRRSHLITAQYGSGKTYFLLMLAGILDTVKDEERFARILSKFSGFTDVVRVLNQLKGRKYLVVHFSAKGQGHFPFKELLIKHLIEAAQEAKPDIVLRSEYSRAAEHLGRIVGRETGELFRKELDRQREITIAQLREGLLDLRPSSLQAYQEVYKSVVGAEPSRVGLDMKQSLASVLDELQELGFTDVAVIVDELTQYLLSSIQHRSLADTLGELENFAEFCNDGRNNYLFVAAMHRSLDRIMREHGMDPDEREDHRKMRERFDDRDIVYRNYNELLSRVFEVKEEQFAELKSIPPARKQLADWRERVAGQVDEAGVEPPVTFYFPLHPETLRYLRGVTSRLGRETRTAFQFIADVVKPELSKRPLLINGRLNVFTPDELFDYFLPDMDQADEIGLLVAHNTTRAELGDDPMAMSIFKCLAMQYVNSTVTDLRVGAVTGMTIEQLEDTLNISETEALEHGLEALRAVRPQSIHYDSEREQYWFGLGGAGWDVDAAIADYMRSAKPNPNKILRDVLKKEGLRRIRGQVLMNPPSSVTVTVKRSVEHEWQNTRWLREAEKVGLSNNAEARFVFIIPDFAEGYDGIPERLDEQARKLSKEGGVCIVLPKSTMMLDPADFRRLAALRYIQKTEEVTAHEQRMRIVRTRLQTIEERTGESLIEFLEPTNYAFYVDRQLRTASGFEEASEHLFSTRYPGFPRIEMESVSGRGVTNPVINGLIADETKTLPDGDQSVSSRFIRDGMPALGLVSLKPYAGGQMASLTVPDATHPAYEIWREVVDSLDLDEEPIKELYKTLLGPPYGLPDFLIEVYVSTYLSLGKGHLIDLKSKRVETTPSAKLAKLITKQKDTRFEVIPPGESVQALRNFMISVWELTEDAVGLRHHKDTDARTLSDQALWFNHVRPSLKLYATQILDPVEAALRELGLSSAYEYVNHFREGLSEVACSVDDYVIPDKAYDRIYKLCTQLPPREDEAGDPQDDPNIAFYRLRGFNSNCLDFLRDDQSGEEQLSACIKAIGSIKEATGNVITADHKQAAKESSKQFKRCCNNIFDGQSRMAFVASTRALWEGYVQEHQAQHEIIMQLRGAFGQTLLDSTLYVLLQRLNPLCAQFGLRTADYFDNQIEQVRATAHRLGQRPRFPAVTCPVCGVFNTKGDSENEERRLRNKSAALTKTVSAAAGECLERLLLLGQTEEFQEYMGREEEVAVQNLWQHFADMTGDGGGIPGKESLQKLVKAAPELVELVQRFQGYQPPPPPPVRVPTSELIESFKDFLRDQGIAAYSYTELTSKVKDWLLGVQEANFLRDD